MNPSVSVYYPLDRAPARRDLAAGVAVSLALLAGAFWYGQAARRAFVPAVPAPRAVAPPPVLPPIVLTDLVASADSTAAGATSAQPPTLPEVLAPPANHQIVQPLQPPPARIAIDPHAVTVPPAIGAGGPERVYNPDALDQPPAATFQPAPAYPYALKRAGLGGTVVIDFIVETNGATSHVTVAGGRTEFGESAAAAVARWRFHPGRRLGRAVRTHLVVPVRFTLESQP
jgi:protein TonB